MAACCPLNSPIRNFGQVRFEILRISWGDKGCGNGKIAFGELRARGGIDAHSARLSFYDTNCQGIRADFCPGP
jgi:hypothetical protein